MSPGGRCVAGLGPASKSKKNGFKCKVTPEFIYSKCSVSSLNHPVVPKKINIEHLVSQ